jgi:hypothetical protein
MPPRKTTKATETSSSFANPAYPAPKAAPFAPAAPAAVGKSEVKGSGTMARAGSPLTLRTITHEQIAKRAYEIYASRGYAPGDQMADWLEAERQLRAGL